VRHFLLTSNYISSFVDSHTDSCRHLNDTPWSNSLCAPELYLVLTKKYGFFAIMAEKLWLFCTLNSCNSLPLCTSQTIVTLVERLPCMLLSPVSIPTSKCYKHTRSSAVVILLRFAADLKLLDMSASFESMRCDCLLEFE
jgi:hypothetical protein